MHILNQALAYIQRYSIYLILVVIPIVLGFNIYPIQTIFPNLFPELEYVLFPYVYGKNIIFRILVELGLLAWFVRYLTKQAPGIQKPMQKLPLVAFCVLLLTLFVSNMLGSNPMFSLFSNFERMEGWFGLLHVLGFLFLIMVTFTTREMYHRGFWAALLGSICVLYAGFVEFIHRQEQAAALTASLPDVAFDMRVQSTLGNAAYVGIYAVFGVAFAALLLFAGARSRYQKFALWAIMLGHTVLLYTTATRSSWLGLCIGIAVFALVVLFKKYNPGNSLFSKKFIFASSLAASVTIAILLAIFFVIKDIPAIQSHPVLGRFAAISTTETTSESRLIVWEAALKGFFDKPLLGFGQEGFGYVIAEHYDTRLYDREQWYDRAHNIFFDLLIAGGVFALIAYLGMFVSVVYLALGLDNVSPKIQGVLIGVLAAYFVHLLFVFDSITSYIAMCLIFAYIMYETYGEKLFAFRDEAIDLLRAKTIFIFLSVAFVVLAIHTVYYPTQKNMAVVKLSVFMGYAPERVILDELPYAFGPALFGAEDAQEVMYQHAPKVLMREDISGDTKKYVLDLILKESESLISSDPSNPRNFYMLGVFLLQIGMYNSAIDMLSNAVDLSPNKQSFIVALAEAYSFSGDFYTARTMYERAYVLDKTNTSAQKMLSMTFDQELLGYQMSKDRDAEVKLIKYKEVMYPEI